MKINRQNYVDEAERVIQSMIKYRRDATPFIPLTTSKLRNLLSMTAQLKTDAQHSRGAELSLDLCSRVQYLKMRIAYEAGRELVVKDFVEKADLYACISEVGKDRQRLLLFCDYMEALTAYHRYYGGKEN